MCVAVTLHGSHVAQLTQIVRFPILVSVRLVLWAGDVPAAFVVMRCAWILSHVYAPFVPDSERGPGCDLNASVLKS